LYINNPNLFIVILSSSLSFLFIKQSVYGFSLDKQKRLFLRKKKKYQHQSTFGKKKELNLTFFAFGRNTVFTAI